MFIAELNSFQLPCSDNPNQQLDFLASSIHYSYSRHAPLINKLVTVRFIKKFVSPSSKALMKERDCLLSYCKRYPEDIDAAINLRDMKKRVKRCILEDTKLQLDGEIKKRGLRGGLNRLFPHKKVTELPKRMELDLINNYFASISQPSTLDNYHTQLPEKPDYLSTQQTAPFRFNLLCTDDIRKAWKKVKNPNSLSLDTMNLCPKMIDLCMKSHSFQQNLVNLYNSMITSESIPKPLKLSRVVPIPKVAFPSSPNDLRPIAVQPVLTKFFEKCTLPQLTEYFDSNKLLCKEQFGFRKHHSTTHALVGLTDLLYEGLAKNHICLVVPLDFRKAFDKVDKTVLLHKLKWYNVNTKLIDSFLSERSQYVSVNCICSEKRSEAQTTSLGVPQGACSSCLYFSILINDLPKILKHCKMFMFADDATLVIIGPASELNELVRKLKEDLNSVTDWLKYSRLALNYEKIYLMLVCKPSIRNKITLPNIAVNGHVLQLVNSIKIVGLNIDHNLDWTNHMKSVNRKCYAALNMIYPVSKLISFEARKIFAESLVLSKLYYASCVWFKCSKNIEKQINKIIRSASRFALGRFKFDSISMNIVRDLGWLDCKFRYKFEVLKVAYKLMNNFCPEYFVNYLPVSNPTVISTRSRSYISQSDASSVYGLNSFKYLASQYWCNVPDRLKCNVSFVIFKKNIYEMNKTELLEVLLRRTLPDVCNLSCIDSVLNYHSSDDE
jgi:hypothetical protein